MRSHPLKGEVVESALLIGEPKFIRSGRRRRGRKGMGLRYEAKVQRHLGEGFDGFIPGPWFRYCTSDEPSRINYAQPDGLLIDLEKGQILICEVKYSHTAEAYFQLVDKYLPIVRKFFNNSEIWEFATVEICYWYDCAVAFPTKPRLRKEIDTVRPNELAVHICRP